MCTIKNFFCGGFPAPLAAEAPYAFTWRVRGCKTQLSYRLCVKTEEGETVFDSGEISSKSLRHTFTKTLAPATFYRAELTVLTDEGEAKADCRFRTSLCGDFGSEAKWIGVKTPAPPVLGGCPATYLKKEFSLENVPARAFAQIAGLGLFTLYVNGVRAHESVLNSPFVSYHKKVFYETFEVSKLLQAGKNTIEVVLGDGWYHQCCADTWRFWNASWKGEHKLLFRLDCEEKTVCSDESWRVSEDGAIYRSVLRLGEWRDNRKTPSYGEQAVTVVAPEGKLVANGMHPILECERLQYRKCTKTEKGYLLDFGRNIAGYAELCLTGRSGQEITLVYGDKLTNGKIDNISNSQYIRSEEFRPYFSTDKVILKEGENRVKPQFVYHGFQFIEVLGLDRAPKKEEITACFIHTSYAVIGKLNAYLPRLNKLQRMATDSANANFVGIPTDCPHREKNGWTGDLQLSVEQKLFSVDCEIDLLKYLGDIFDTQLDDGQVSCIAPTAPNIFGYEWGNGPAWDTAIFEIAYRLWQKKGNASVIGQYLPAFEKYYAYLLTKRNEEGLVAFGLDDWCLPTEVKCNASPLALTDSLIAMQMAQRLALFCTEIYGTDKGYGEIAESFKRAVVKAFVKADGTVADGGITAHAAVLYFGAVSGKKKEKVLLKLLEALKKAKYTMQYGILGNKYTLRVLCENGRYEEVLKLLHCNRYPSFGYWIKRGAVTLWEDFEASESLNSRNHYMFSDYSGVFYEYFAGIRNRVEKGEEKIDIRLPDIPSMQKMRAQTQTVSGVVAVRWEKKNGRVEATVDYPANAEGYIYPPNGKRPKALRVGKHVYSFPLER